MTILWKLLTLCCILLSGSARATAKASFRPNLEKEAQDEIHDVEILKAVYTSMEDYWMRRLTNGHRTKRADSVVCYGDLGCFEDAGPFSYIDMLPSSPEEISTKFQLYSGKSRGDIPLLEVPYSNLSELWNWSSKLFNVTVPVKIIVHGFGSSCNHEWVYEMKSALLSVEDCNVICVDWEAGALIPNYVRAVANTRLVGKQVAMLIQELTERGLTLDKVHLIGFSLGAHVAGFAGAELKNVSRITGLDPAGPLFESQDPKARLDESDANFVDVIHSNGENLILGGLGSWQPMGHVDFYPNGGRMQKGCTNLFVGAVSDIIWSASDIEGRSLCNHRRAYKFFTDSVSPQCHFPSFPCESYEKFINGKCFPCSTKQECGSMGYYADKSSARGSLYLITREEEPFCAHQYHVKVESSPSKVPVLSYGKIQITLIGDNLINETFTLTKKDDEELGVGTVLSRIVVPHPALEPAAIEIVYTAYSGWISSGLRTWSIDKVKLGDSYGKSISHCKKDLVLDSKVPVTLKLFPGDCNLPKEVEVTTTEIIDPFFIKETVKPVENKTAQESSTATTSTSFGSTTNSKSVFKIPDTTTSMTISTISPMPEAQGSASDNLLDYKDEKNYYVSGKDSEKGVANQVINDNIVPKLQLGLPNENYTMKIVRKHEITEPVLQPKFTGRKLKDEVDEPVLKAIETIKIIKNKEDKVEKPPIKPRGIDLGNYGSNQFSENQSKIWVPPQDLYPPPLGLHEFWGTTRRSKTIGSKDDPFHPSTGNRKSNLNFSSKLQEDEGKRYMRIKASESVSKPSKNFYPSSSYSLSEFPRNKDGTVTVQFFPQYLAVIMKQAEQYAKMNLFSPLDIFAKPKQDQQRNQKEIRIENKKETSKEHLENLATPRYLEQTINFFPKIYEYIETVFEKSLENMKSLFGVFPKVGDGRGSNQNSTVQEDKVIRNTTTTTSTTPVTNITEEKKIL